MPTDRLSATDRARLQELRRELAGLLSDMDFAIALFSASSTAYRERTGKTLDISDPSAHLTDQDKLRALELFRASCRQPGLV